MHTIVFTFMTGWVQIQVCPTFHFFYNTDVVNQCNQISLINHYIYVWISYTLQKYGHFKQLHVGELRLWTIKLL